MHFEKGDFENAVLGVVSERDYLARLRTHLSGDALSIPCSGEVALGNTARFYVSFANCWRHCRSKSIRNAGHNTITGWDSAELQHLYGLYSGLQCGPSSGDRSGSDVQLTTRKL